MDNLDQCLTDFADQIRALQTELEDAKTTTSTKDLEISDAENLVRQMQAQMKEMTDSIATMEIELSKAQGAGEAELQRQTGEAKLLREELGVRNARVTALETERESLVTAASKDKDEIQRLNIDLKKGAFSCNSVQTYMRTNVQTYMRTNVHAPCKICFCKKW